ncbi:MAG: hypothetical protein OEZ01_18210 [Candidatus Heimdallarchaeota archaeon]|nr:hypothetical protein [Candidatus Heimdallarchaeota archaeon]
MVVQPTWSGYGALIMSGKSQGKFQYLWSLVLTKCEFDSWRDARFGNSVSGSIS